MNENILTKISIKRLKAAGLSIDNANELLCEHSINNIGCYKNNIERYVGTVKVPVGLAGPVEIKGKYANGEYYIPLATTEGALVASYNRGCSIISRSGGAKTIVIAQGVSRSIGFILECILDIEEFTIWLNLQKENFCTLVTKTSRFASLQDLKILHDGLYVYVIFQFSTGNAAGQNMVTMASHAILRFILDNSPVKFRESFLETNLSSDKKASFQNMLGVRGRKVIAEVILPENVVTKFLHCTTEKMAHLWSMCTSASMLAGYIGVNAHYANALAAIYLACGQDVACVAESAVGITRMNLLPDNSLHVCVTMPDIIVGTVGGGTQLPSQNVCFKLTGIKEHDDSANEFAELIATACLAGEISIVGSMAANDFAKAHSKHGRGKIVSVP